MMAVRGAASGSRGLARVAAWVAAIVLCASSAYAQNPNWPEERPPSPLPAKEVTFPPYEVRALANGMQVVTVLHHEQPAVTMHLLVRTGSAQDPGGKDGLATLTAQLLDQGTTTKSAEEIADQIDSIGGSLATGSGADRTTVSSIVMKDSFDFGMNLIADVVRNPAFAPEEIERQKEQLISSLQVNAGDPDYVANVVFDRLVFGFHPYGLPGGGTPESLAGVTREDIREFHRRYFVPNNMILAIVGDVTRDEAFAGAERVFGGWVRRDVDVPGPIDPPPPTRRVIVIDKPDSVQTEIRAGGLAIPRKHPDYLAWDLGIRILGGEGANRLHRILRSERGLTYGASASSRALKQAGHYVAETDTRTETTAEALALMIAEMVRLRQQRVSDGELGDAQAYLAGSFPLTIETPVDIASQVLHAVFYDLPLREISTFVERVRSVTPEDIQRVVREHVRTDRLSIVLVGNAGAFVPELRKLGLTELEVIPIDLLDLNSPTLRRDRFRVSREGSDDLARVDPAPGVRLVRAIAQAPAAAQSSSRARPAAPRSDAAATELMRQVVAARGGVDALRAVRSVVAETETMFLGEQGEVAANTKTTTYVQYPDRFRVDATIQDAVVSQIYDAGRAWEQSPNGVRELPVQVRDEMSASVRRDTIPLLMAASDGRLSMRMLPEEREGGRRLRVVELSSPDLEPVRLHVGDDMLIARQTYWLPGPDGKPVRAEESFSDYRIVGAVRVPFEAAVSRDGQTIVRRVITAVRFNEPLEPSLFARPTGAASRQR